MFVTLKEEVKVGFFNIFYRREVKVGFFKLSSLKIIIYDLILLVVKYSTVEADSENFSLFHHKELYIQI